MNIKCPKCGSGEIAAECRSYVNFRDGSPEGFDDEDLEYAEPLPGGACVCRNCQHTWDIPKRPLDAAAPDLLAALERISDFAEREEPDVWLPQARAAIAKARGA